MVTAHTVCPLDCPDRCSLEVKLAAGRALAIEGSRVNPLTAGFICAKVRRFPERVYGPDRLLHPMCRTGTKGDGRFTQVSWNDALALVARRLEETRRVHGGEAILPFAYGGSNGLVSQGFTDERLFRALGASRLARTVCAAQTGLAAEALYGKMASVDFPDFARARFVLIWGANPKHSNIHLMPYLKRARAAGARIVLVDPRRTLSGAWIDDHVAVRPGTDLALALAMIFEIERKGGVDGRFLAAHATGAERLLERAREWPLERAARVTGVAAEQIAALARAYLQAEPALVRCGWGVERNRNGEAAVAAILALPAIAGKFGKAGGGYALSASEAYRVDADRIAGLPEAQTRIVNMSRLGRVLLEERPPVRALFVYDANPAVTVPDQKRVAAGLMREDLFTVVFDQVMTDTARYADVLLPATTFLEHTEISPSYGTYALMLGEPLIAPVGEARPNEDVFRELAERLGLGQGAPRGDARLAAILAACEGPLADAKDGRDRLGRLRRERVVRFDFPGERPVQFVSVFPGTSDRRVQLWPEALGPQPYRFIEEAHDPSHPLILLSPATDRSVCSTLAEYGFDEAALEMHPGDAAARGLSGGSEVRVFNALGEVRVPLRLSSALTPGVVVLPKGIWRRHTRNGVVGTALVSDDVSALSGGALFNDARVEVGAVP
jgi:anaerobic selenocysteine-containing dehydrogenase